MMPIFSRKTPAIYSAIEEFTLWQSDTQPYISGAEKSLLYRFVDASGITSFRDLTPDKVAFFVGQELSEFYTERARKAVSRFLRFARWAGYANVPSNDTELRQFMMRSKMGRPRDEVMMSETRQLIKERKRAGKPVNYHELALALAKKHKRPIHKTSVFRWAHY